MDISNQCTCQKSFTGNSVVFFCVNHKTIFYTNAASLSLYRSTQSYVRTDYSKIVLDISAVGSFHKIYCEDCNKTVLTPQQIRDVLALFKFSNDYIKDIRLYLKNIYQTIE